MSEKPANTEQKQIGQKRDNIISSAVLICLSVFMIIEALEMDIMMEYAPGPGLFPMIVGVIMFCLSLSLLIENLISKKTDKPSAFSNRTGIMSSMKLFVGLIVFALLIRPAGYIIAIFLLLLYITLVVEKMRPKTSLIASVVVTAGIVLIFQVALQLRLPKGILGF